MFFNRELAAVACEGFEEGGEDRPAERIELRGFRQENLFGERRIFVV